jgi:hypothetical protein
VNYQASVTDSSLHGRFVTVSSLKHILSLMSLFNKAVILNFNKIHLKYSVLPELLQEDLAGCQAGIT